MPEPVQASDEKSKPLLFKLEDNLFLTDGDGPNSLIFYLALAISVLLAQKTVQVWQVVLLVF